MHPGEQVGPYRIEAPLGEGGMGAVYRARDTRLDRTVALKVSKAEFSERFEREAKAVAALNHPNICTLFDVGPNYLVMELIEGTPLKGPLPVEQALEYGGQILDALDAAHRKGFTHRDLKPANILVTKQGIKLLDFGLAKQSGPLKDTDETLTQALTGAGQLVGTLQYMAPEQLQGKPADARSDLFAFGCVLYELLSGKRAFEGQSAASVIAAILEREPAPLELAPPLDRVIQTCLRKDPDKRFQNAVDLKRALAWAMEQQTQTAARANRWPWIAAAMALALGVLGVLWGLTRSSATTTNERAVRLQLAPPDGGQFDPESLAVSTNGQMLAYVATSKSKSQLWVRALDGATARALPGTEGAAFPFWSPDGRSLGFFVGTRLWRIEVAGGAPQAICALQSTLRGAAWGTDGKIVLGSLTRSLWQVPAAGGSPTPLTVLDAKRGEVFHSWPQRLPGTGTVLYFAVAAKPEDAGIYAARLDRPEEPVRILATNSAAIFSAGHLLWRRGTTLVAQPFDPQRLRFSGEPQPVADPVGNSGLGQLAVAGSLGGALLYSRSGGDTQLTWFDRTGQSTGTLGPSGAYYSVPSLSPDGRRLVVGKSNEAGGIDLWLLEVGRDASTRFTFTPGVNTQPVWSPDGRTVIFRSGSPINLFRKESSGAGTEERVTASRNAQYSNSWSSDGGTVLYYEISRETNRDLWVLPVTREGKPRPAASPRPYLRTPFNERNGRFSPEPNPRWVAYESDESGRYEIYLQAFPEPKGKRQISSGGGQFAAWSPDGQELYYLSADNRLMAVKLEITAESVRPAAPVPLFAITRSSASTGYPYALAPDGRFIVEVPVESGTRPLDVILNWPALLKKGGE